MSQRKKAAMSVRQSANEKDRIHYSFDIFFDLTSFLHLFTFPADKQNFTPDETLPTFNAINLCHNAVSVSVDFCNRFNATYHYCNIKEFDRLRCFK